jgi:hypothetical protein
MKTRFSICVLLLWVKIAYGQVGRADEIIGKHLDATSKTSWSNLKTLEEKGITYYPDSVFTEWESFQSGAQKKILSFDLNRDKITLGENKDEIWRISNGKIVKTPKFHVTPSSKLNFSYALERRKIEDSSIVYLNDTIISDKKYHIIQFQETNLTKRFFYINSQNYTLEFAEFKGESPESIHYSDFTWVNGYLFPLVSVSYSNMKFKYKRQIRSIKVNAGLNDEIFKN